MELELLNLLLVLVAAWIGGSLATRLGYPSILGELTAGIIFGPLYWESWHLPKLPQYSQKLVYS